MENHLYLIGSQRDLEHFQRCTLWRNEHCHLYFWNKQFTPDQARLNALRSSENIAGMIFPEDHAETLNNIAVSVPCTRIIQRFNSALERLVGKPEADICLEQIPLVLANIITQDMRPVVQFVGGLARAIRSTGANVVHSFGAASKRPLVPARPDIPTLYFTEVFSTGLAREVCAVLGIVHLVHTRPLDWVRRPLSHCRHFLISAYKFLAISRRIIAARRTRRRLGTTDLLVLIRAESEYYSVTPLLEHLAGDKALSFAIIQDDLLRHPSAKRTLDRAGVAYIPIHSETTLGDLLKIAGKIIFDRRQTCKVWQDAASTMLAPMKIDEPAEYDDIAQICAAPEILVPTLQSSTFWALEVLVFARQFADLIGRSKAKAVLCLDMIDKWGEVVGHLGRRLGCTTFTLQNAAMSNLVLPKAISTDFFYAVGSAVREHLVTCGADPDRVLVSGSPAYEKLRTTLKAAKNCDNRKNRTSIPTIAITPQPFADRPDLNEKLIRAVCKAVPPNTRAKVIIKLHPRETPAPYERIRSKINEPTIDIEIWHGESLPTLFGCSDLLVSRTSTTLMTAQFAAMPSVAFLSDMEVSSWNSIDYMNSPSILKAFSENELRELLHGLLFSESCEDERAILEEKMRQFVADNMGTFREGPTQGIANHIKRTISTAKSADV